MGYRTKKITRPQPSWPEPTQWHKPQKATIDQNITFNIMVLLSHIGSSLSSIILIFSMPKKQDSDDTPPAKKSQAKKDRFIVHCPARVNHDPSQSVHKKPQRAKKLLTNRARCACKNSAKKTWQCGQFVVGVKKMNDSALFSWQKERAPNTPTNHHRYPLQSTIHPPQKIALLYQKKHTNLCPPSQPCISFVSFQIT